MRKEFFRLAIVSLVLTACGQVTPVSSLPEAREETAAVVVPANLEGVATWNGRAGTNAWTSAVLSVVMARIADFEKARDVESFCPGYARATDSQRKACWLRLVSAVTELESDFDPAMMYRETFGVWSVGLMQLSPNECPNAPTIEALKKPVENLICGSKKMASLIARYGYITSPDGRHGAAAYWSTLRGQKRQAVARISGEYRSVMPAGI